ncbi:MAG: hypothetical protein LBP67_02115 [Bacteroidales bacterium]|jgi:hypothetical protein|nr:hypothetical protein [Bacteroidales bacterium]
MKKPLFISVVCLFIVFFASCEKKDIDSFSEQSEPILKSDTLGFANEPGNVIILGNKLENAYSVQNMTAAYASLKASNRNPFSSLPINQNIAIVTTHLYICFKPQDTTEYNYLIDKSGLSLFAYPMDYEIIQHGLYYVRPDANEGDLPWLYTTIPVNKANDINLSYDILDHCFIPEELLSNEIEISTSTLETLTLLELTALMQTNNITQAEYNESLLAKGSKYPTGYIKVRNTNTNSLEGVKKVKVRVHNIVKWCEVYTDEIGYYKMSKSYLTKVHYATIFENSTGFKIWGNLAFLAPANYDMGWNSSSGFNKNIETNSKAWLWSTVNNATYLYIEKMCPAFNITKPPSDLRLWTVRLNGGWLGSTPMLRRFPIASAMITSFLSTFSVTPHLLNIFNILPDIFILKDFTDTKQCYSTVFHELSHASHYVKAGKNYWLAYIEGIIANNGYGTNANGTNAGYIGVGEMWGNYFEWRCMNNTTILGNGFGSSSFPTNTYWFKPEIMKQLQEPPCNLTTKQIYDCLTSDVTNHSQFKTKLISKYGNSQQITQVFTNNGF